VIGATNKIKAGGELHSHILELLQGWNGFPVLDEAMHIFADTDVFIAGGVVRDVFSDANRKPNDFDFFLHGPQVPEFVNWIGERGTLRFGPFGSPRWWPHEEIDPYADLIPVATFDNGLWACRNIVDALNQFDFTANAVALNLRTKELFDPQNGVLDARQRIMRAVRFDYPDEPISQQCSLSRRSVMWTRLVHYANTLDFSIEPVTRRWLQQHSFYAVDAEVFGEVFFPPCIKC